MPDVVTNVLYKEIDHLNARVEELESALTEERQRNRLTEYIIRENEVLTKENMELHSLVDGVTEIVELFDATSPAQHTWKVEWLRKAREALLEWRGKTTDERKVENGH